MPKFRKLIAMVIFVTQPLLTGCALLEVSESATGSLPSDPPNEIATSERPSKAPPETISPKLWGESEVLEVVERSYLLFEEVGMTERVVSDGEEFVLLFDPQQPDYQAAWFNLDTGESELIFETDYFTLFVAYLMVDVPGHEIEIVSGGFVLSAPEWNPIEYIVKDGLLTGAKGVEFDWVASFDYSVDADLVLGLETLAAELIESFEE